MLGFSLMFPPLSVRPGGSLRRRGRSGSPEVAGLENTLLLTSTEFWKFPPSHGENTGGVFHLFSQGYRGWNNLFLFSKTITPVGGTRVGGKLRCFWKLGWQLSFDFNSLLDLPQGAWQARGRAQDQSSESQVDFGFAPWDDRPLYPAWLCSQASEGTEMTSSWKSAPLQCNHLHGVFSVFSVPHSFVLSQISVSLAILASAESLPDNVRQPCSFSLTLSRHQIPPSLPVLIKRPVDTKIQVPVE